MRDIDIPPPNTYPIQRPDEYGLLGGEGHREPTPEEVEQFKQAMLEEARKEEAEQKAREAAALEAEARAEKVRHDKADAVTNKVEKERVIEKEVVVQVERVAIDPIESPEAAGPVSFGRKPAGAAPIPETEIPVLEAERRERGERQPSDPEGTFTVTASPDLAVVTPTGFRAPGKPKSVETEAGVVSVAGVAPAVHAQIKDGVPVVEKSEIPVVPGEPTVVAPQQVTPDALPENGIIPAPVSLETTPSPTAPLEVTAYGNVPKESPTVTFSSHQTVPEGTVPVNLPGNIPGTLPESDRETIPGTLPGTVPQTVPEGTSPDGFPAVTPDGFISKVVTSEAVIPEGFTPEAVIPEGIVPKGATPEGATPEGVVPKGVTPEAVVPEGIEVVAGPAYPTDDTPGPGPDPVPVQGPPTLSSKATLPESDDAIIPSLSFSGKGKSEQPASPGEPPVVPGTPGEEIETPATFLVDDSVDVLPGKNGPVVTGGSETETFTSDIVSPEGTVVPKRGESVPAGPDSFEDQPEISLAAAPQSGKSAPAPEESDIPFEGSVDVTPEAVVVPEGQSDFLFEDQPELQLDGQSDFQSEDLPETPIPGAPLSKEGAVEPEEITSSLTLDDPIPGLPEGSPVEKPKEGAPTPEESEFMAAEADDDNLVDKPVFNLAAPTEFNEREAPITGEEDILIEGAGRVEETEKEEAEFWSRKETELDLDDTDLDSDKESEFIIRRNEEIAAEDPIALEAAYPILPAAWGANVEASPQPPVPQEAPGGSPLTQEIISLVSQVLVTDNAYSQAPEMRMTLHESVLPGTEIRFRTEGGVLEVTLYSETGESADTLRAEAPGLESALEGTTGGPVRVTVLSGNENGDGRG